MIIIWLLLYEIHYALAIGHPFFVSSQLGLVPRSTKNVSNETTKRVNPLLIFCSPPPLAGQREGASSPEPDHEFREFINFFGNKQQRQKQQMKQCLECHYHKQQPARKKGTWLTQLLSLLAQFRYELHIFFTAWFRRRTFSEIMIVIEGRFSRNWEGQCDCSGGLGAETTCECRWRKSAQAHQKCQI